MGSRARAFAVVVLLLSYGAVGARQPAVRTSVPLPVPAEQLAQALGLEPADHGLLLVSIVRLIFDAPDGLSVEDYARRAILNEQLRAPARRGADTVPLPLDVSIWRDTLLDGQPEDGAIVRSIFASRQTALLYHGLFGLDDDTLGWLGPDRETLRHLRSHAGTFAAFGPSVKVRAGRVAVPGGVDAEPIWAAIVGADPGRPAAFVQRLMRGDGRLAWFYDTLARLDPDRLRFVLGARGSETQRVERVRALLEVFLAASPEWQPAERPFVRPALDPGLALSLVAASRDGRFAGIDSRAVWDAVLAGQSGPPPSDPAADAAIDPAWLMRRLSLVPSGVGRARLQTVLFSQRALDPRASAGLAIEALRGAAAYPTLALTLERIGEREATVYAAAARTAAALHAIRSAAWRRAALAEFQAALAIVERTVRAEAIDRRVGRRLTRSLVSLPVTERGFGPAFEQWLRREVAPALPVQPDAADAIEEAILAALAGARDDAPAGAVVEWEGRRYRVEPAAAELKRLRRIRERQRALIRGVARSSTSLDARLAALARAGAEDGRLPFEQAVADTLTAIVYATALGEPHGAAASAGDAAARHEFAEDDGRAWQVAREDHGAAEGWRLTGSLLGLDAALARLALRRLDLTEMPAEPTMSTAERASAAITAALFRPASASLPLGEEIAAALARGRERAAALHDPADAARAADAAGMSEWRREALRWSVAQARGGIALRFSLAELFWLGGPRGAAQDYDDWGAATFALDGCLCLRMPGAGPWETRAGRHTAGHLAAGAADVPLRVAEALDDLRLPAALAPAVLPYAMQDVLDRARPAWFDDWAAFERAARDLERDRVADYVAAAVADGALLPVPGGPRP